MKNEESVIFRWICFLTQRNKETKHYLLTKDTMSSKAAYKVHKVFPLQAFVATFKSLVVFVSKEKLRSFVSLCLK